MIPKHKRPDISTLSVDMEGLDPSEVIRLNCEIPRDVNDELNNLIPHGSKSDVVRGLLIMYIKTAKRYGRALCIDVIDGTADIVIVGKDH